SDADGLAEIPVTGRQTGELRLVARSGTNFAVNTLADYAFRAGAERWMGYLYTDRPVYRPGHTVHFKGILRLRNPEGYTVPAGKSVSVEVQDSEQKPVYRKTLTVSATGTVRDDVALA